jgi:hypothetical protein
MSEERPIFLHRTTTTLAMQGEVAYRPQPDSSGWTPTRVVVVVVVVVVVE